MAVLAGQVAYAGRVPGERIGTDIDTANSGTFVAETLVQSLTVDLIAGRTYQVRVHTRFNSSVLGDTVVARLREDSVAGNELTSGVDTVTSSTLGTPYTIEAEYTPASNETKTFVVTGLRSPGTGNIARVAASNRPSYLMVSYVRG